MAEDIEKDSGTPEPKGDGGEKTFTQEELNRIVTDRIREEKERSSRTLKDEVAKALAKEKEAQRIASLEGEERLKAEFEAQLQASQSEAKDSADRLAKALTDIQVYKAEGDLAKLGLPTGIARQMVGKDEAETKANIESFSKIFNEAVAAKVADSLAKGAPSAGGAPGEEAWKSEMKKAFGL